MASGHRRLQPRKRPRQVRAELTRERILTAAAHVFTDHGYAAGTTNRIAERARISIGSLYQYYPNKDAILVELATRHVEAGVAAVKRRMDDELPHTLEEIIRSLVRTSIENHLDDPQLLRVLVEQAPRSPELLRTTARHTRERTAYAQELIETYPEVRVEDTYVAARLLVSVAELLIHQLIAEPDPVDAGRLETELVAMLTRYLTAAPPGGA